MLPNNFPDAGGAPEYNTVDATLWYFEAVRQYFEVSRDMETVAELFPVLEGIIDAHVKGTRYNIHADTDGLLYAGSAGAQLTWMDAKVGDWVVTPRTGKAVEVNALWINALETMKRFAGLLGKHFGEAHGLANHLQATRQRCFSDKLAGPAGRQEFVF